MKFQSEREREREKKRRVKRRKTIGEQKSNKNEECTRFSLEFCVFCFTKKVNVELFLMHFRTCKVDWNFFTH